MTDGSVYYQNTRREIATMLPNEYSRVLEIGCGEGNFRRNLNTDCEYWGVEPNEAAARIAARNMNKVLVGTYQEVSTRLPKQYFDLVICNDVIEHMTDHDDFLESIRDHLSKAGFLVASVPNVRYIANLYGLLVNRDWRYKNSGVLDRTHLRFFTEKSLRRTLTDHAFLIEDFRGINSFGDKPGNGPFTQMLGYLASLVLGQDTKFLQFGMRVRNMQSNIVQ